MHQNDFEEFRKGLLSLSQVFGKELNDAVVQGYWDALRDLSLSTIQACSLNHSRYGKFFPKPAELRPKTDKQAAVKDPRIEAEFRAAERRACEHLDWLWQANHEEWLRQVSGKVYELGRAKGMLDGQIAQKLRDYVPTRANA